MLAGRCFDKELITHFEALLPEIIERAPFNKEQSEIIPLAELAPGMIMGEELRTGSQLLLIERGETVTSEKLSQLRRAMEIDRPQSSKVLVGKAVQ